MAQTGKVEMVLTVEDLSLDALLERLIKTSWLDEGQKGTAVKGNVIEFVGGQDDIPFKLTINDGLLVIEASCPWELELMSADLNTVARRLNDVADVFV